MFIVEFNLHVGYAASPISRLKWQRYVVVKKISFTCYAQRIHPVCSIQMCWHFKINTSERLSFQNSLKEETSDSTSHINFVAFCLNLPTFSTKTDLSRLNLSLVRRSSISLLVLLLGNVLKIFGYAMKKGKKKILWWCLHSSKQQSKYFNLYGLSYFSSCMRN